ncbi:ABC transporter substrate-binding protein [Geminicoccus roseus]|uniref:ABC transporter substrate-binding protein n=1 Tax=Geminicoccus roseus TaxID=404900 RepID=UPI0003FB1422|nr:sugar ABC transporter substrate-binding protein [Geminicoccus roseus]
MKRRTALLMAGTIAATWPLLARAQAAIDWEQELGKHPDTTLRILMIQDPWVSGFEQLNPTFEKLTGTKVVIDAFGYDQTHEKEVLEGTSQSSEYDIIVLDSPWVGEFWSGEFVEDLKPYIEKTNPDVLAWDDFVPAFQQVAEWEDTIVGVPFGAYFMLMHYRKDLFEQAGMQPPRTIDEYKAAAKHFTDNPDFPGMYGTALNNARGSAIGQSYFEWIYNFGGKPFVSSYPGSEDPYADMTPQFTSAESQEVFQFFKDMLAFQPPGAESIDWEQRAATFTTGKTAMITAWSVRTPLFHDPKISSISDKVGTAVFPHKDGIDGTPPLGGWVMGINSNSNQKDLAWDYIKWFTSKDVHKQFVLLGGPPSRISTMQDPEVREKMPWVDTIYETQKNVFADCRPRIPESFEIIDTVGFQFSRALQDQASVDEALGELQTGIADLMVKGGYTVEQ